MLTAISTSNAPVAVGPFSQAIKVGQLLFVSGQLPIDPATGEIVSEDPVLQLRQCLKNISAVAAEAGTNLATTVKTTVLITDMSKFGELNEEYATFFKAPFPARACFEVSALPKGAQVEVEAVLALYGFDE
ncbi:reactive intermediate/imine deaminase [Sinorhizobium medicae]|uniref:RidA family protein n=1 Tax=Sinorhizobium medicae TaxID=110321 RepID=UPI000C7C2D8F|nr:RidA family protein [Sinorhizobium medicae]PLT90041.1 reactive intermediate/imine deaminase [Sinorhizobium medicae]